MNYFSQMLSAFGRKNVIENLTQDQTKGYRANSLYHADRSPEDLPFFRLQHALTMTADPVVQFGLHVRDALISAAEVEIETNNEELGKWLRKQWDVIWGVNWFKITQAKQWGFEGLEVLFEVNEQTGYVDVVGLKDFSPFDVRPLRAEGNTVGMTVRRHLRDTQGGSRQILMPKALWTSFGSRWGSPFGRPILRSCYSPWWEKWMKGGAKKVLQLRMVKDAYRGMMGWYDPKATTEGPNGEQISYRDLIRQSLENLNAGGIAVMPLAYDSKGNKRFDITDQPPGTDPKAIFEWNEMLNAEIWQGLDVPKEIIEAASTGSGFSGRSIPFAVALQMIGGREFSCYMEDIDRMVLRPAAELNFGNAAVDYTIKPKNLVETYTEILGGSDIGGGAMGGGQSQAQGATLEEASAPRQLAAPEEQSTRQPAAEPEPQKEFIDVKLANGQTIQRRNPNFGKAAQFAEFDESKVSRVGKGSTEGGRFGKKAGGTASTEAATAATGAPAKKAPDMPKQEAPKVSGAIQKQYPAANPDADETLARYTTPDGKLTKERQQLHDGIVADILATSTPVEQPVSYMMGGGPASGKSSITNTGKLGLPDNIAKIDSDEIKKLLPEFQELLKGEDQRGASFVHEESSGLGKRVLAAAIDGRHNSFLDGTGDSGLDALRKKTNKMRKGGRRVIANYVSLDTDTAVKIARKRGEETGRVVPEKFLRATHATISEILPQAIEEGLFNELTLWDTNTKDEPFKMLEHKDGKTTIIDQAAYDRFLSKANV